MFAALTTHEDEHHNIFLRRANRFRRRLQRMRGELTTGQMRSEWDSFVGELARAQQDYDRRTRNGARDGVSLTDPSSRRR